ncbi:MAG: serine/threonine protein kinase [Candidatus Melainabacteria bacterium]|nr:serine/threonine protein kinase [Candidatus Melainabacteria bacterium]
MHQKQFPKDQEEQSRFDKPAFVPEEQEVTGDQNVSAPDKFIGTIIAERYEILDMAGRGGMSVVYRARHLLTQKIVALKLMHSHLVTDESAVRRFQQEAKAASRLHHNNAISVQDMGVTDDGQPFLTMDYLDGRSLSQEIKDCKQIEPSRCIHIFLQVCSALAHAHDQRIVHRDLKPSNVMLIQSDDDSDYVKVVDFGIAKILMEGSESLKLTATGEVFGSPYYMSPEQCMGQQLDARSDIYSMGCLMFESLTGRVPHEGKNVLETMYKHTNLATPALTDIKGDPRLMLRLDQILQKCMAKVPEQRYQSMIELRDDLTELSGTPQKGFKLAAKLGINAADKGRKFDNRLAALSSKKLFWAAVPLLTVLGAIVVSFGYYWASTAGDPSPADRELMINRNISSAETEATMSDKTTEQCASAQKVLTESLKKLNDSERSHDTNIIFYSALLKQEKTYTPEANYNELKRYGRYFMKTGDYGEAIDAFEKAINTSVKNKFALPLENADIEAAIATCLMATGDGTKFDNDAFKGGSVENNAMNMAFAAYNGFHDYNVKSTPPAITNMGNLLELFSSRPDKLQAGFPILQELLSVSTVPPSLKALVYYQASQFASSCETNGITAIPLEAYNQQTGAIVLVPESSHKLAADLMDGSLKAWEQLERKRSIKRIVLSNEGVIYNRLGLMAEKDGNLELAAANFESALQKFVDTNENDAAAKVLFNLSDVRMKQHDLIAYYNNHRDAKRIWDGLLHPVKLDQIKKH